VEATVRRSAAEFRAAKVLIERHTAAVLARGVNRARAGHHQGPWSPGHEPVAGMNHRARDVPGETSATGLPLSCGWPAAPTKGSRCRITIRLRVSDRYNSERR
jgi:hypothetical protein